MATPLPSRVVGLRYREPPPVLSSPTSRGGSLAGLAPGSPTNAAPGASRMALEWLLFSRSCRAWWRVLPAVYPLHHFYSLLSVLRDLESIATEAAACYAVLACLEASADDVRLARKQLRYHVRRAAMMRARLRYMLSTAPLLSLCSEGDNDEV